VLRVFIYKIAFELYATNLPRKLIFFSNKWHILFLKNISNTTNDTYAN